MAITFKLISSTTLSSTTSSLTISSIPSTYDDLIIYGSFRNSTNFAYSLRMQFNSDTSNSYYSSQIYSQRSGSPYVSGLGGTYNGAYIAWAPPNIYTAGVFGVFMLYIPQYKTSNFKSFFAKGNMQDMIGGFPEGNYNTFAGGSWGNNSAISSITFYADGQNILPGSSAKIYGISKT